MVNALKLGLRWLPWCVALAAAAVTVHLLLAQVALQGDLNLAMEGVLGNVREAGKLTGETAEALAPLRSAAETLERINGRLRTTAADLAEMNGTMGRIADHQQEMILAFSSLTQRTQGVVTDLGQVDGQNRSLLETTRALTGDTAHQADTIENLFGLTGDSITHLQTLNRRLQFLRKL